ncbi:MAG: four helix bundle protein [Patescibacteria group bacterium]|nr:four helix bundle protein [Patescibacteria group bacterium]
MKFNRVEDIRAWQKSTDLVVNIYNTFYFCKDYSFKDQIERAAVSVPNNISEGFERGSNKDFVRFLFIAKASCSEVRSMLLLALRLNYINESLYEILYDDADHIIKMISKIITNIKSPFKPP